MINFNEQQRIANFTGALSHLLLGKPGRFGEFIQKAILIFSNHEPHTIQLMRAHNTIFQTGIPLIWVQPTENPYVPRIGLAALCGGKAFFLENCMLWMAPGDDRARLVPDSFNFGAFQFKNDLNLRYSRKSPARFDETPGMTRAYNRLLELQIEQRKRGEIFELPEHHKAA